MGDRLMDDATLERVAMLMARKTPEEWEALSFTLKIDWRRLAGEAVAPVDELGLVVSEPIRPVGVFDESTLRADIVRVWGEHGAHVDVFDHMLRLTEPMTSNMLQARLDKLDRIEAKVPELIEWARSYRMHHVAIVLRDLVADTPEAADGSPE